MRVMVLVKANPQTEAGQMPKESELAAMGAFNEELVKAGADFGWASRNAGTNTWTFADGTVTTTLNGGRPCRSTATLVDGGIKFATGPNESCGLGGIIRWVPTDDGIRMILVPSSITDPDAVSYAAWLGVDWVRIE